MAEYGVKGSHKQELILYSLLVCIVDGTVQSFAEAIYLLAYILFVTTVHSNDSRFIIHKRTKAHEYKKGFIPLSCVVKNSQTIVIISIV